MSNKDRYDINYISLKDYSKRQLIVMLTDFAEYMVSLEDTVADLEALLFNQKPEYKTLDEDVDFYEIFDNLGQEDE